MENFAKLIQAEWENIWDFVFGRDIESEPTVVTTDAETATDTLPPQEPSTDNETRPNLLRPGRI